MRMKIDVETKSTGNNGDITQDVLSTAPPKPVQRHCSIKTLVQGLGVTRPRMHKLGLAANRKHITLQ